MKRKISLNQYDILKKELLYLEEVGELSPSQAEKLLQHYEIIGRHSQPGKATTTQKTFSLNFIQIISIIGAILIGLGVLSFVASNWSAMSSMQKFTLLLITLFASYIGAWWTEERKPNTSKALYYIGAFLYGAEIFYIGQMFHLGGEIGTAFMAWAIGILPLAMYRKDQILYGVGFGLFYLSIELIFMIPYSEIPSLWMIVILPLLFVGVRYIKFFQRYLLLVNFVLLYQFIEMRFMMGDEELWIVPILIGLFALNKYVFPKEKYLLVINFILLYQFVEMTLFVKAIDSLYYTLAFGTLAVFLVGIGHKLMNKSKVLFAVNVIVSIQFLLLILFHLDVEVLSMYFFVIFLVGIVFTHYRIKDYEHVMKWMGYMFQLSSGILLTMPFTYEGGPVNVPLWLFFGLGYIVYGMYVVYKNKLFGVLIVSLLIFRFYVDLSLVFMNKSIAFFIGGLLLLGLGYWFEKNGRL